MTLETALFLPPGFPFLKYFILFFYYFLAPLGLHCCVDELWQVGATLQLWCVGFLLPWLLLLWSTGSTGRMGFSSCGSQAQLLRGTWGSQTRD